MKPITYWLPTRVANPLADEFGDYLEHMPKNLKLLAINVLSGVLHEMETNPCEEYSSAEYVAQMGIVPSDVTPAFQKTLDTFDQYDCDTIESLVMVLAIAVAEQR